MVATFPIVDGKARSCIKSRMEQRPIDRSFSDAILDAGDSFSRSDELAASLANLVVCDYAVTAVSLCSPLSAMVEAGWSAIYVVRVGDCWLTGEGLNEAIRLQAGDAVLLPRGRRHWLSTSDSPFASGKSINLWERVPTTLKTSLPATQTPTAHSQILACRFRNHIGRISSLLSALPTTIHVPAMEGCSASLFESTITLMDEEATTRDLSGRHIVPHLIQILFMQIIRQLLARPHSKAAIHESAFKDPVIGASLGLLDSHLEAPWTLASLADAVGVSRSTFAARFMEKMGTPPLAYLWQRRMEHAVAMLGNNDLGIKEIASRIGYKSESAFSTAFKRWSGMTPGAFRRNRQNGSSLSTS